MKTFYQLAVEKANKKKLRAAGFSDCAISLYAHAKRIPDYEDAVRIAKALGIAVKRVPYRLVKINLPDHD